MLPNLTAEHGDLWLGAGLIFAAALVYSGYLTGVDRLLKTLDAARFTSLGMCISCLSVLIHFGLTRGAEGLNLPGPVIFNGFLMGVLATVLPIYALTAGIARIGASKAAMVSMIGPVLTSIMGYFLLGERLTPVQWLGMGLVMAGVWRVGK